jgi:hypothetical protein
VSDTFKIGGHEFAGEPGGMACMNCGQLYREFLRDGGGCVTTGPHVIRAADGSPQADATCKPTEALSPGPAKSWETAPHPSPVDDVRAAVARGLVENAAVYHVNQPPADLSGVTLPDVKPVAIFGELKRTRCQLVPVFRNADGTHEKIDSIHEKIAVLILAEAKRRAVGELGNFARAVAVAVVRELAAAGHLSGNLPLVTAEFVGEYAADKVTADRAK